MKPWIRSGDLGKVDEDGYIFIVGPKKDVVTRGGGTNVYPVDVERHSHSDVIECAVVGKPDPMFGEILSAYVVSNLPHLQGKT